MSNKKTGGYSFNSGKTHNGQYYTGMKVGSDHHWTYSDAAWSEERSLASAPVAPQSMRTGTAGTAARSTALRAKAFQFDAVKTRVRKAPIKSGAATGTGYHWFFVSQMETRKNFGQGPSSSPGAAAAAAAAGGSGSGSGSGGGLSDQAPPSLLCTIRGDKFKVGHKRPDWNKWSYDQGSARSAPGARAAFLNAELQLVQAKAQMSKSETQEAKVKAENADTADVSELLFRTFPESWQCTEIIWNETKRTPDRWSVFVQFQMTPPVTDDCSATPDALLQAFDNQKFLIIAEQLATKLHANAYQTSMHGEKFHLGRIGADTTALECQVMQQVLKRFQSEAEQHNESTAPLVGKKRKQVRRDCDKPATSTAAAPALLDALRLYHAPIIAALQSKLTKQISVEDEQKEPQDANSDDNPKDPKKSRVETQKGGGGNDINELIARAVKTLDFDGLMHVLKMQQAQAPSVAKASGRNTKAAAAAFNAKGTSTSTSAYDPLALFCFDGATATATATAMSTQ